MTPPDELYPRWYLAFSGFVWGVVIGVVITTYFYETAIWHAGDFWRLQMVPLLITSVPPVLLAFFEIFFRLRRHLRLQRRVGLSQATA